MTDDKRFARPESARISSGFPQFFLKFFLVHAGFSLTPPSLFPKMMDFLTQETACATPGEGGFLRGEVLACAPSAPGARQRAEFSSVVGHHLFVIGFHAMKEPNDIVLLGCDEKTKLRSAFQSASESYSMAVVKLSRSIGAASHANYDKLHRAVEQASLTVDSSQALSVRSGCLFSLNSFKSAGNRSSTIE